LSGIIIISFVCFVWFGLILFCLGVWVRGHYFEKENWCRVALSDLIGALVWTTLDYIRRR
jgi:uncharacterized membrane protein